jgi:hypothetical protein
MRRITIFILNLIVFVGVAAAAQQILPTAFDGWTGSVTAGRGPSAPANGGGKPGVVTQEQSAALSEYGFVASETANYKKGSDSFKVDLYRMKDPSGAYGLLTYLRTPDMNRAKVAAHSFLSNNEALMLAGNLVLDVQGKGLRLYQKDLKALVQHVTAHAEEGALPTLWEQLPAKQMIPGSDKYLLGPRTLNQFFPVAVGDSVGFSTGGEAEVARYRTGSQQSSLLLVDLPTPQIATQTLQKMAAKFNVNGSKPNGGLPIYAKRLMTTLVIVAGAPNEMQAHALLNEVKNTEVLTWNEPSPKGKQADIGTIVVGTIIGTGVICAFSVIAGLAFGGFRLAIKRILPGKVFDRAKHMEVIQLGLSSKPINPDDFYDRSGPRIKLGHLEKNLPEKMALRLFR